MTVDDAALDDAGVLPGGFPLPGIDLSIVDPDEWGVGEVVVRSRNLAAGYWRDPERTAKVFVPDRDLPSWRTFRTGDLGRFRDDGMLELHGRRDNRVKLRGYSVDL